MHPPAAGVLALALSLTCAAGVAAQAPAVARIPLDGAPAQAGAALLGAGFARRAESPRLSLGADRRVHSTPADGSEATYTREGGGVTESVYLRATGGRTALVSYTAVGDSAALQARLDAEAGEAARLLGPGEASRGRRAWRGGDGRSLSIPARPQRLPDGRFSLTVLQHRP